MGIFFPKVIVKNSVHNRLLKCVYATEFEHETGGILLGYQCLRIIYIIDFTAPRHSDYMEKMTFVLNGNEHMRKMEQIKKKYLFSPRLVGIWHSHTTDDRMLSLQDEESSKVLVGCFGNIVSMIVTRKGMRDIRLTPYYVSKRNVISMKAF